MTNKTPFLLAALFSVVASACVTEPTQAPDPLQPTADETRDQELDPTFGDAPATALQLDTASYSTCAAGEVGDYKWLYAGCCSTKERQQLARCDGHHWIPQVGKYRCLTLACPI